MSSSVQRGNINWKSESTLTYTYAFTRINIKLFYSLFFSSVWRKDADVQTLVGLVLFVVAAHTAFVVLACCWLSCSHVLFFPFSFTTWTTRSSPLVTLQMDQRENNFFSLHKIFKFDEHTSRKVKAKQTKTKQCFKSGNCGQTVMTNRFDVDHSESVCLNQMKMFNGEITTTTMTKSPNNFTATVASARAASIHFFIHAVAAIDGCLFLFVIALDKMLFLSHLHTRKVSLNNRILILQMLFALTHDTIIPTKQKKYNIEIIFLPFSFTSCRSLFFPLFCK